MIPEVDTHHYDRTLSECGSSVSYTVVCRLFYNAIYSVSKTC